MKFSRTFTNKLVSFADRYFSWDRRYLKREDATELFDFYAVSDYDDYTITVCINRGKYGIWASIKRDGVAIQSGFLKTYTEVNAFKKMIKCLG